MWFGGSCVCVFSPSVVFDSATLWTAVLQAPLSLGFSRQEYWSRLLFPIPRDLPDPGIEHVCLLHFLHWQAGSLPLHHLGGFVEVSAFIVGDHQFSRVSELKSYFKE